LHSTVPAAFVLVQSIPVEFLIVVERQAMSMRNARAKRDRRFHFEALEDRNLLSAIAPHAAAEIRALKSKVMTHVVGGAMSGTFLVSSGNVVSFSGTGNLTVMGETTVMGRYTVASSNASHKSHVRGGTATLSDNSGDEISVKFTGVGKVVNGNLIQALKGKITGGQGELAGATGTFSATSTSAVGFSGSFELNVKLTAKTRK
jgi:hypothetical protein